jgi:Outer membrane protein beta-barrel domain
MKRVGGTLSSLAMLFAALTASADDDGFARSGWYAGLGAQGQFYLLQNEVERETFNLLTVSNTVGFMARGGYRLTRWFAAEAIYECAPGFNLETNRSFNLSLISPGLPKVPKGTKLLELTGNTATANANFNLPFWRVQPYLILGLGGSIVSTDDPDVKLACASAPSSPAR